MNRVRMSMAVILLASAGLAPAGVISDVQSPVRPLGLDIVAPVMQAGGDLTSATFNAEVLPTLTAFKNVNLSETRRIDPDGPVQPAPHAIALAQPTTVRAYFVSEAAGYHNAFGFNATGQGIETGDPLLIFPDASMRNGNRNANAPLKPGDYVDLGTFAPGTALDLLLVRNGDRGGDVWTMDPARNRDGLAHAFTYQPEDHPDVLMVGWEDLVGGGDRDYNDVLVALTFTPAANATVPEPASLALLGLGIIIAWHRPAGPTNARTPIHRSR